MATTIKLINGSSRTIKAGDPVKLHATKLKSFDYAILGDILIGTLASQTNRGSGSIGGDYFRDMVYKFNSDLFEWNFYLQRCDNRRNSLI